MQLTRVFRTNQFKRDAKALFKKHYDASKLAQAIEALLEQNRTELRTRYRDHALKGNWQGYREIHVEADWLVIYRIERDELLLVLSRTGSYDDLF
ncbi:type II toxin-antitoxin system RelE/ParE family toxin [Mobiluncus mulieris]|uniref:type II toxin-antitoxin system RelE/ParE family toxin n=1 Tax=Mobiluncus mulieris TaxID=2052 RepID=UPI00019F8876|nr:type II toxin-antitoxin system YafQ family toxin [Mobiluncus mulieris]EEJ54957.1 addiction module toxin, RelE/StbE family [Mobiluncus mulieris ATCC 35243]MCV0002826.1 type II toxin-antitoxin system YafQ family toxin [Mobiluncus mulieris]SPX70090.1 mRNA interferase YafQ [Mobiluncus mulieris]STY83341.1 mRNA interferase YafQ [Mobiluncus mulieris]